MNRKELALKCVRIEAEGGSVREFLKDLGFVSPWGTWFRLQKEDLGRKDYQITDGRGDKMRKVTLEQKKKAVDIALSGGNPLAYLKEIGSKQPSALWYAIKKALKEADPEKYGLLEKSAAEPVTTCCAPARPSGVEVPDKLPEESEGYQRVADVAREMLEEIETAKDAKPVIYGGFEVMALKSPETGFKFTSNPTHGMMTWNTVSGDHVCLTAKEWHKLADDLPRVLQIFGI